MPVPVILKTFQTEEGECPEVFQDINWTSKGKKHVHCSFGKKLPNPKGYSLWSSCFSMQEWGFFGGSDVVKLDELCKKDIFY